MKLLFAKNIGFCFGVQNAVDIAQKAGDAYTYGHIIHNEHVIEKLRKAGVNAVEELETLKSGDTLILRSHGAPKSVYEKAEKIRGFDITFVTTAKTDEEAKSLLKALGLPFAK